MYKPNIYINKPDKNNMKKGDFSFETIVKIILALLVLLFIIALFVVKYYRRNKVIIFKPPKGAFFILNENIPLNRDIAWLIGFFIIFSRAGLQIS